MARAPPFFPLIYHLPNGYCALLILLVAWNSATLRQPAPLPVVHLLWLRTPLPNFPVRAPAVRRLYRGTTRNCTAGTAVLLVAAPDHCGPPGPAVSPVAVLQQPWLREPHRRTVLHTATAYYCPAVHLCRAPLDLGYERMSTPANTDFRWSGCEVVAHKQD